MVWTIPIRWDLNTFTVLARSSADMSPTSILWTVLWIVQYAPVLPIPALSKDRDSLSLVNGGITKHTQTIDVINMSWTCNAPLLGQNWVVSYKFFSKFHEQQECPGELHGQAIQGTECAKQT